MKVLIIMLLTLGLISCASTQMKGYVGKSIQEANLELGSPEKIKKLPNGKRAYQYRWGGGTMVVNGKAKSIITNGNIFTTVDTVYTPARIIRSKGCLVTLIASKKNSFWIVEDWKIPQKLVC